MDYKLLVYIFIQIEISIGDNFWKNFAAYIKENDRTRFRLAKIFVYDRHRNDFISLKNDTIIEADMQTIKNFTIRVAVPHMPPYIKISKNTNAITGYVGDIWNVFQEFLKFKTDLLKTSFENGTFYLIEDAADVMLTAGIATPGYSNLEYSQPYFYNWYQLYMKLPSRTPNSTFYIRTLAPTFWYACIVTFLILTVALRMTVRILNRVGRRYHSKYLEPPISLPTCFMSVISGFFNQGFDVRVRSYSARAQVMIALVFGYTVYSGMSAVLVSELAVSELAMPIKSLEDVVAKGKWSLCVRDESFVYTILAEKPKYRKLLNTKACEINGEVIPKKMLCRSDIVILESQAIMSNFLMKKRDCEIINIHGKYYRRGNSIMFNKQFKYRKLLHTYLEKLRANGILHKLQNQWVRRIKEEDINPPATIEVTLYHVKGILVLYGITIGVSVAVFIIECVISKFKKPSIHVSD